MVAFSGVIGSGIFLMHSILYLRFCVGGVNEFWACAEHELVGVAKNKLFIGVKLVNGLKIN